MVADSVQARDIAQKRQRLDREAQNRRTSRAGVSLEEFFEKRTAGEVGVLRLIIKADQGGPAEALADALSQLSTGEVRVEVVHRGVGTITDSDVLLAKASGAIVIGFHVRPDSNARASAAREHVDIRLYRIIYEAVEDVKAGARGHAQARGEGGRARRGRGPADLQDLGRRARSPAASCSSGTIVRTAKVRVIRDGVEVYAGGPRVAAPLQGRREGSEGRAGVRHRHRELQRPQGRRRDRGVPRRHRGPEPRDGGAGPRRSSAVVVGVRTWDLHLAGCQSLKDKRRVVKSLKDRLHDRFNVSAAEVDHQDVWQRAALAASVVTTERRHAEEVLGSCDRLIAGEPLVHVVASTLEFR